MAKSDSSISGIPALTDSQQMVLDFIESYSEENQRPPTIREIQSHCGFASPRAVSYIVEKLEAAKFLFREARSRGLFSTRSLPPSRAWQLPLFESIPAGLPDRFEGTEAPETLRFIPGTMGVGDPSRAFAVRVKGESMIGAHIEDGDVVILEKKEPVAGDIVAALIDGECTLKRLLKKSGRWFLQAENPKYPSLEPLEELSVQGVLVGLLRNYAGA